jgi:hypothetical protein
MRGIIDNMTKDAGGDVYRQARASRAKYARDFEDIDLFKKSLPINLEALSGMLALKK